MLKAVSSLGKDEVQKILEEDQKIEVGTGQRSLLMTFLDTRVRTSFALSVQTNAGLCTK